jgi:ubiquinone/menaquinone biosynthesis C-methylase UbiE
MQKIPSGNEYLNPDAVLKRAGLESGRRVGDFGTGGSAYFALQAARAVGPRGMVFAIDAFKPALSSAMSKAHMFGITNIRPVWSDLEVYGGAKAVHDETLDFGLLVNVLHQSKKHELMLRECARMLKPGARILIIEWRASKGSFGPPAAAIVPEDHLKKHLERAGFAVVDRFDPSDIHFAIVAVKTLRGPVAHPVRK